MKWETEKEEKAELLNSWIENTSETVKFAKTLCKIIKKSPSKKKFIEMAQGKMQEHWDPWIRKEFKDIINFVI